VRARTEEHWPWAIIGLVVAAIVALVVVKIVDTNEPLSVGEAEEAIEGMPYRVTVRETPDHILVGEVRGSDAVVVHFAAAESLEAHGIPARLRRLDREPTGGANFWTWDDSEVWRRKGHSGQSNEAASISTELDEVLCRKETGKACSV
jgi:hypothetical protein